MAFPPPPDSKGAIRRAGRAISEGRETSEDLEMLDQWRGAHGYALNTFQANFRKRISRQNIPIEFVQRLKRRNTIIDKLRREGPDGRPLIRDLVGMHDLAGCRLIFDTIPELREFRSQLHIGFGEHLLKNPADKYDYIETPKRSGYRGVHDVYIHRPRSHRRGDEGNKPWWGLAVEIQFRTKIQNSWATAVEMADLIGRERTKFEHGDGDNGMFFRIASEIIARKHEGLSRCFLDRSLAQLIEELHAMEDRLNILGRLSALRAYDGDTKLGKHNVLNIVQDEMNANGFRLEISRFSNPSKAMLAANAAESDPASINAVYVRSDNPYQLRTAYKNYFSDPTNFVDLLDL